jgi:hypothetical protein
MLVVLPVSGPRHVNDEYFLVDLDVDNDDDHRPGALAADDGASLGNRSGVHATDGVAVASDNHR